MQQCRILQKKIRINLPFKLYDSYILQSAASYQEAECYEG